VQSAKAFSIRDRRKAAGNCVLQADDTSGHVTPQYLVPLGARRPELEKPQILPQMEKTATRRMRPPVASSGSDTS
jgi:hypothetical protein